MQTHSPPRRDSSHKHGVVLIIAAGMLAILAAMGAAFFVLMQMQIKSAVRYDDSVRASLLGQAGIQYGIAQLRTQAFRKTEDPTAAWYMWDWMNGGTEHLSFPDSDLLHNGTDDDADGTVDNPEEALPKPKSYSAALTSTIISNSAAQGPSDRFTLSISDAAGKINVNAGDNLGVLLDNLCRVIGRPLVAAQLDALQPRRWAVEAAGDPVVTLYDTTLNTEDLPEQADIYYTMTSEANVQTTTTNLSNEAEVLNTDMRGRPKRGTDRVAIYGDGYAIAGYRARHGAFKSVEDVKNALTYVERNGNGRLDDPLERLEIEVKFAALRDYITIDSWVETNTVCVGKFEWVHFDSANGKTFCIDRDKSWIVDDPAKDPFNTRGSLRGCYLSIMNGHGAGQLRRIRTNGIDWIEVDPPQAGRSAFAVTPGPVSSYMIVSNEEAAQVDKNGTDVSYSYPDRMPPAGTATFPKTNPDGTLVNNRKIDYSAHPLCIHRAPVNVNTASDKVLEALLLGINVQHGHPLALGTDADLQKLRDKLNGKWKRNDIHKVEPYVLTPAGLKRLPADPGKVVLNRRWDANVAANQVVPPPNSYHLSYLNNYDTLGAPDFSPVDGNGAPIQGTMTEAHELAYRIIMARQTDVIDPTAKYVDPDTGGPTASPAASGNRKSIPRGPFRNYDDLYFRVIKPWNDLRVKSGWVDSNGNGQQDADDEFHIANRAPMIMANFNSNLGVLKFNPNIEWIDRWGRNFTALEPVMVYTNEAPPGTGIFLTDVGPADPLTPSSVPIYTAVTDPRASGWAGPCPPLKSSQMDNAGNFILGAYVIRGFRYKSDEMIDKTDLNRSTAEFSFDSNGVFEIISTGQVLGGAPGLLAERRYAALVKVYDVWRESSQSQFVQGTISDAVGRRGTTYSGQLARDATDPALPIKRKGLVTLPEPLLPLAMRIRDDYPAGTLASAKPVPNVEEVSAVGMGNTIPLDAFGNPRQNPYDPGARPIDVPEVLANRILPARYDGQITLATNTSAYRPLPDADADTFLATFDGDPDTATCMGNGREQAKWPYSAEPDAGTGSYRYTGEGYKHRCVQSIGLLGLLNDMLIASDPGIPLYDGKTPYNSYADKDSIRWIYPFFGVSTGLMPLKLGPDPERPYYWNNVTVRMGSLRTDGAYLTAPGVSGNTATLKYLFSPKKSDRHTKLNYQPDSKDGNCVSMWAKTAWHHDDMRAHEFFNPGNEPRVSQCGAYHLMKYGQYKWCSADVSAGQGQCCNRRDLNDLMCTMFFQGDSGYGGALFGGYSGVISSKTPQPEAPGYHVQPFRWSFLGYRSNYVTASPGVGSMGPRGHWTNCGDDWKNVANFGVLRYYVRPFIDTALFPESPINWNTPTSQGYKMAWVYRGCSNWGTSGGKNTYGDCRDIVGGPTSTAQPNPTEGGRPAEGQDAKWVWAEPYGKLARDTDRPEYSPKCFSINNLNFGNPVYDQKLNTGAGNGTAEVRWHYRNMPEDGTYAVIDELKISNRDFVLVDQNPMWPLDRITRTNPAKPGEMTLSRYYLPPRPNSREIPEAGGPPTFTSQTLLQSRKGVGVLNDSERVAVVRVSWNVFTPRFMCEYMTPGLSRLPPTDQYISNYAAAGAAQQLVPVPIKGPFDYDKYNNDSDQGLDANPMGTAYGVNRPAPWNYVTGLEQANRGVEIELLQNGVVLGGTTFTDPTGRNALGTPDAPVKVKVSDLCYRVRFMYPADGLCDPNCRGTYDGKPAVDLRTQYLLDTPVFDDISVAFVMPWRLLAFREVSE